MGFLMSLSKYDTVGGRRYVMCMGACIACTVLIWYGKLDAKNFADIVIWVTGIYVTGNIAQRAGTGMPDVLNKISGKLGSDKSKSDKKETLPDEET